MAYSFGGHLVCRPIHFTTRGIVQCRSRFETCLRNYNGREHLSLFGSLEDIREQSVKSAILLFKALCTANNVCCTSQLHSSWINGTNTKLQKSEKWQRQRSDRETWKIQSWHVRYFVLKEYCTDITCFHRWQQLRLEVRSKRIAVLKKGACFVVYEIFKNNKLPMCSCNDVIIMICDRDKTTEMVGW